MPSGGLPGHIPCHQMTEVTCQVAGSSEPALRLAQQRRAGHQQPFQVLVIKDILSSEVNARPNSLARPGTST